MTMTAWMFQTRLSAIALSSRASRSSENPTSDGFAMLQSSAAAELLPIAPPISAPPVAASSCRLLTFVSAILSPHGLQQHARWRYHVCRDTIVQLLLLRHLGKLSIIRAVPEISHTGAPLAKSQWSFKTAVELKAALRAKQVSAVELAQDAIGRIERHDGKINAICVRDFERALEAARAADKALVRGESKPLLGIPLTAKESYNMAGLPTTYGMPDQKNFIAREDALAVTRVRDAGG